jgi:hypothetical protein
MRRDETPEFDTAATVLATSGSGAKRVGAADSSGIQRIRLKGILAALLRNRRWKILISLAFIPTKWPSSGCSKRRSGAGYPGKRALPG